MIRVWEEAFGDREEAVRFFDVFFSPETCLVLESDDAVRAIAHVVLGAELSAGGETLACPYLYAVAVDSRYRGLGYGKAICEYAVAHARALGYRVVATCPADDPLVGFYRSLGFTREERLGDGFRPSAFMVQTLSFLPRVLVWHARRESNPRPTA